jgi:putative transcriptional regulator
MTLLKGQLLVAAPSLVDPNFFHTVLLMLEHSAEGAAGLILNRPTDKTMCDVAEQVFKENIDWPKPVHLGGPVPGPVVILHTLESLSDGKVLPGVFSTMDSDKLRQLVQKRVEPSLLLANYAGWGPGQLEAEIEEDSWRFLPARADHIFWTGDDDLWRAATHEIGRTHLKSIIKLPETPPDPNLN